MPSKEQVKKQLYHFLQEDIGSGDVTSEATVSDTQVLQGRFISKAPGIVAGLDLIEDIYTLITPEISSNLCVNDGEFVKASTPLAIVSGPARSLLLAERLILNLIQRMSGIASLTQAFVQEVQGTKAVILDTRKTAPGLRHFDKWAVRLGGGQNHRMGLYDQVLIKENHITAAGSISQAVKQVRTYDPLKRVIEVEVTNLVELKEALTLNVDRIMLDNMDLAKLKKAVQLTANQIPLEASGGVSLNTVKAIAQTGVDFISVGELTHSVKALDISFLLEKETHS